MIKNLKNFPLCGMAEMDFHRLGVPRNVSVDMKYVFCACERLCMV